MRSGAAWRGARLAECGWPGVTLKDSDPQRAKARVESYARRLVTFFWFRQKKVTKEKATPLIPETPEIEPAGWASKNSPRFCNAD